MAGGTSDAKSTLTASSGTPPAQAPPPSQQQQQQPPPQQQQQVAEEASSAVRIQCAFRRRLAILDRWVLRMVYPDRATAAFFIQPQPVCTWEPAAEDLERSRARAVAEAQDAVDDLRALPGHLGAAARAKLDGVAEPSAKSAKRKARKERARQRRRRRRRLQQHLRQRAAQWPAGRVTRK